MNNFSFSNSEVVKHLKEVSAAMEVKEVNRFRIRAYDNAIDSISSATFSIEDLWKNGRLHEIPGIGASIAQHLDELFKTGKVKDFETLKADLPQGMFELIGIRGIAAKRAYKLAHAFKISKRDNAVQKLREAAESGQIRELEGFGEKSEKEILNAIMELKKHKNEVQRMLLTDAEEIASRILEYLLSNDDVKKADALGSLRRREATVGDIDLAVATVKSDEIIDYFCDYSEIKEVVSKGNKKVSAVLKTGVPVDLRVIEPSAYGSMLQYFTGSKQHNVILRTFALEKGLSLSEYGIKQNGDLLTYENEQGFYEKIGLKYIEPELRQGRNEVELAAEGKLPNLVVLNDIKGDLHMHTTFSDGINTLAEMVNSCIELGYEYIGVADHAPSTVSRGENEVMSIINTRKRDIEQINSSKYEINVLFGYEVNILSDATLGMPDEFLMMLDYAIASIHTAFDQPQAQVTDRMLAAIENPYITIIGHPSGRLINERSGVALNWDEVFNAALKHNKILEINSQPNRLDLADDLVYEAIKRGVKLIINTDAHSIQNLQFMKNGIDVARRGWCTKQNIVNTLPKDEFLRLLSRK